MHNAPCIVDFSKSSLKNYMQLNHSTRKSTVDINPKKDQIDTEVSMKSKSKSQF